VEASSECTRCNCTGVTLPAAILFRAQARSWRSYARRHRPQQKRW